MCEKVLLQWAEECVGDEEAEQLTCEGKDKELAKGSIKGLLLDFAIYLSVSLLRLRKTGIGKEPEEKERLKI